MAFKDLRLKGRDRAAAWRRRQLSFVKQHGVDHPMSVRILRSLGIPKGNTGAPMQPPFSPGRIAFRDAYRMPGTGF